MGKEVSIKLIVSITNKGTESESFENYIDELTVGISGSGES